MDEKLSKILHIYFSVIDTLRKEAISNKLQSATLRDDLAEAYGLLSGLGKSQESPWIKIEPGCELPLDNQTVFLHSDGRLDFNIEKSTFHVMDISFFYMISKNLNVYVPGMIKPNAFNYYWMPVPPLPGGKE